MGHSQVPYFVWAEDESSPVRVVMLVDWGKKARAIRDLPTTAIILDRPDLPDAPQEQWRIRGDQIIVDASIVIPPDPRTSLLAEVDAATTIAQLKTILRKVIGR